MPHGGQYHPDALNPAAFAVQPSSASNALLPILGAARTRSPCCFCPSLTAASFGAGVAWFELLGPRSQQHQMEQSRFDPSPFAGVRCPGATTQPRSSSTTWNIPDLFPPMPSIRRQHVVDSTVRSAYDGSPASVGMAPDPPDRTAAPHQRHSGSKHCYQFGSYIGSSLSRSATTLMLTLSRAPLLAPGT